MQENTSEYPSSTLNRGEIINPKELFLGPLLKHIEVQPDWERLTTPQSQNAIIYKDPKSGHIFRQIDISRHPEEIEISQKELYRVIEIASKDDNHLTPKVYSYDP